MFIQRCILTLMVIFTSAGLYAQQPVSDVTRLKGEWQIEKVEAQLFAQQGNQLLEEKVYTTPEAIKRLKSSVPLDIQLTEHECIIKHRAGLTTGRYILPGNSVLEYQQDNGMPQPSSQTQTQPSPIPAQAVKYTYRLPQASALLLNMPALFYKDKHRNLAVKLVYTCYYRKKP